MTTNRPSTNLIPAIVGVVVVAFLCLALALWLPAPRRPAPAAVVAADALPLPPITEYEISETEVVEALPSMSLSIVMPPAGEVSVTEDVAPLPRWKLHAQPAPEIPEGYGRLAIVIDDMGVDIPATEAAMAQLPAAVTFAFLPYGKNSRQQAVIAHTHGHEILVHVPMEPLAVSANGGTPPDPGPYALKVGQSEVEILANMAANVRPFEGIAVGANNHMGSRFTPWTDGMRVVLGFLQGEGMMFLDSVTTGRTATRAAGEGLQVPLLRRDVFLDDVPTEAEVDAELTRAIAKARKHGSAIAIGHPHPATLAVLAARLPKLAEAGVILVPVTALVKE